MKTKEYIRLAFISFRENKRQNRNLIFALTLAEFLLIPVVFVLLSFNFGFMASVDDTKTLSSVNIKFDDNRYDSQFDYFDTKYEADILKISGITENTKYVRQLMHTSPIFTIDDTDYTLDYYEENYTQLEYVEFYDVKNSSSIVTSEEEAYVMDTYGNEAIFAGTSLTEDETGVVISSDVLDYFGISYEDAIGKEISYQTSLAYSRHTMDSSGEYYYYALQGTNVYVFKRFVIVGVFNTDLYYSPSMDNGVDEYICPPSMWLNLSTLYDEDNELLFNDYGRIISSQDMDGYWNFEYQYYSAPSEVSVATIALNKVFLPLGFISTFYDGVYYEKIQFDGFNSFYDAIPKLMEYASLSNQYCREEERFILSVSNIAMSNYVEYYPLVNKISVAVLFFSVIMMVSGILNVNNVISYSVSKRKGYLGMMRAMGLKDKRISALYLSEFSFPITIAMLISFFISLPISIGIAKIMDVNIKRYNDYLPVDVRLDMSYYPIAFFVIILFVFLTTSAIVKINCTIIEKKKISELIHE